MRPLAGKRIGLLTAYATSRNGGVAEAVAAQARMLGGLGAEPVVFALADDTGSPLAGAPTVVARTLGPAAIGYAPAQRRQLLDAGLDLLHLHGIWMHPSRAGLQWARATRRPYVISPHGMLDPWIVGRGRLKKALARAVYERRGWANAAALHALTESEARDIAREAGRCDALVIANPAPAARGNAAAARPPELVYLGRIHPKKNLAALIAAWTQARRPPQARLTIAGWGDDGDVAELRTRVAAVADGSVSFVGSQFGGDKQRLLETARFLILPSFSEGLPMVVLEAWAAATPTLMSQACNLPAGFAAGAARDCGTDEAIIRQAIEAALVMSDDAWRSMAEAALALAQGPFSPAAIAAQWESAYARLLAGAPSR